MSTSNSEVVSGQKFSEGTVCPVPATFLSGHRKQSVMGQLAENCSRQAVDAPFSHLGCGSSESSIDVGGIYLVFLIRSGGLCSDF